jgi:hypothetical protein
VRVDPGQLLGQMRPPQPDLLIGVVEAACSLCRQRRGDLPDVVSLRAGERQRHIPPPRRAGIRVRTAVGCRHDYRVSHPVDAEDPVSPHSARLSGNRPFTDTRSGRDASGASGAASSRNALRVVQAVVLAGQLTVVLDNSICLVDSPSAQLTGVVPGQDLTHHATMTKVTPVTKLRLAQLG